MKPASFQMQNASSTLDMINYFLDPGFIPATQKPTFVSAVTGSYVIVNVYDCNRKMEWRM